MKTKILFDGNCMVCNTEMMHYQRIAPDLFEMIDISDKNFHPGSFGLDFKQVNDELHLFTPEGKLLTGVDAFTHIWSLLPRYQFAAKTIQLPWINGLARIGYRAFAANRRWLSPRIKP